MYFHKGINGQYNFKKLEGNMVTEWFLMTSGSCVVKPNQTKETQKMGVEVLSFSLWYNDSRMPLHRSAQPHFRSQTKTPVWIGHAHNHHLQQDEDLIWLPS